MAVISGGGSVLGRHSMGILAFHDAKSYLNLPYSACSFSFLVTLSSLGREAKKLLYNHVHFCLPIVCKAGLRWLWKMHRIKDREG